MAHRLLHQIHGRNVRYIGYVLIECKNKCLRLKINGLVFLDWVNGSRFFAAFSEYADGNRWERALNKFVNEALVAYQAGK